MLRALLLARLLATNVIFKYQFETLFKLQSFKMQKHGRFHKYGDTRNDS